MSQQLNPHGPDPDVDFDDEWDRLPLAELRQLDDLCLRFEQALARDPETPIEPFAVDLNERQQRLLVGELVRLAVERRRACGQDPTADEYVQRFPQWADDLRRIVSQRIGRYRIERVLGQGGFGVVYLAHDEQLKRPVAVKVPHAKLIARPEDAEMYLAEARMVARLDHPAIVPVYDVGSTKQHPCYVVSKYIPGTDLATRLKQQRLDYREAAELIALVADALHYAHKQGLVHRDVKPGNILLGHDGRPYVMDFGLALREENLGRGPKYAGTPAYMSPEQARGEGHRVDGRSDIFSLGVVFYELLSGRQPFRAETQAELLERVSNFEPRPLVQYDEKLPKELQRICGKALRKRASERYAAAHEMAQDLRHFLHAPPTVSRGTPPGGSDSTDSETQVFTPVATAGSSVAGSSTTLRLGSSDNAPPPKIVPKGLRSFDAHDADFFLELLPGPRDRAGLPDSLRFWKTRIDPTDPDSTFTVGLIYGPSGCGKTSLVRAGLLPRLSEDVISVYIEATPQETEVRLLHSLRKRCPALDDSWNLAETLGAMRCGSGIPVGKKVLIVLDQFEQWLHARTQEENSELVQALRQCDGGRVQCLVMVRDDFWLAVSRFLRELEVPLLEGHNVALADLFDLDHACKVLAAFGRAFGKLPDRSREESKEQKIFLQQSVAGLAEDGKVVCVRLALFAEMMKGKAWTPAALKEVGGPKGVGLTFLEETFSSSKASPQHRYHQQAARTVLKALLPESGTDIKGQMKSYHALLEASSYAHRPHDFQDLIRILDSEIRLITPTDPEGAEPRSSSRTENASGLPSPPAGLYYQLTHDYLVPSLRDWLTRKQKETRRGRAELLLADRAALWNARPEYRQLPLLGQWLQIKWFTKNRNWTPPQRKMMAQAGRSLAVRGTVVALLLTAATFAGLTVRQQVVERQQATQAAGLVERLLDAETAQVPAIIQETARFRPWVDPWLREARHRSTATTRQQLHASLALLPVDPTQVDYLVGRLLHAAPHEVPVICGALTSHQEALRNKLWALAEAPGQGQESQRLRAAAALAMYDPGSERWARIQAAVANDLVAEPAVYLALWLDSLRPVRDKLLPPLSDIFRDPGRRDVDRSLATDILATYAVDQPRALAQLIMDADEKQFEVLYPKFEPVAVQNLSLLIDEIDQNLPEELPSSDEARERLAKRQANAAVILMRMNQPAKVWPLLQHRPDPRVRSYLIHRLGLLGADPGAIIRRLDAEPDITIRRALLLSLGEFGESQLPPEDRRKWLPQLQEIYRTASDPGLHAAAEWLLRTWQQDAWLKEVNDAWARGTGMPSDGCWAAGRRASWPPSSALTGPPPPRTPRWYFNGQGQTMVVIPGPVKFLMGSPTTEAHRHDEPQHPRRIGRTFALAAKSVTVGQYRRFEKDYEAPNRSPSAEPEDLPAMGIDWYRGAKYCNWLSEQEGVSADQWCFEITGNEYRLRADYLSLGGYRFPTEAEMEYATRAGAVTSRYFGETAELLRKYAWYNNRNAVGQIFPVGGLKPNDLGFFDMQGNVHTWCLESFRDYVRGAEASEDQEDSLEVASLVPRVVRGGAVTNVAWRIRSANRFSFVPTTRQDVLGLRVARTVSPAPRTP